MAHDRQLPMGDRDEAVALDQPRLVKEARKRNPRKYTLFEERTAANGVPRWVRVGPYAYPIEKARQVYGREILRGFLTGAGKRDLRPV